MENGKSNFFGKTFYYKKLRSRVGEFNAPNVSQQTQGNVSRNSRRELMAPRRNKTVSTDMSIRQQRASGREIREVSLMALNKEAKIFLGEGMRNATSDPRGCSKFSSYLFSHPQLLQSSCRFNKMQINQVHGCLRTAGRSCYNQNMRRRIFPPNLISKFRHEMSYAAPVSPFSDLKCIKNSFLVSEEKLNTYFSVEKENSIYCKMPSQFHKSHFYPKSIQSTSEKKKLQLYIHQATPSPVPFEIPNESNGLQSASNIPGEALNDTANSSPSHTFHV